jgi:hypothetical protein
MNYTLKGKIAKAHPYQLDTTLTVEGAGAEAEATGKAIAAARKVAEDHVKDEANPHKVSKEQVGLGNADNTSDKDKPVSEAQAEAIADAKKAGTDAMAEVEKKTEKAERNITLSVSGWVDNAQSVEVEGVTAENTVIISANPVNSRDYANSMVYCTEQGENSLTFTCVEEPIIDLLVNVLILN